MVYGCIAFGVVTAFRIGLFFVAGGNFTFAHDVQASSSVFVVRQHCAGSA
jgi:hypothetical protein